MSEAIGTYDDVRALVPAQAGLLDAVRALVLKLDPAAVEVSRPGDRAVSWGLGPKKMSEAYAYAMPFAAHVNLGFYHGSELPDPAHLLEGTGKKLRHIKLKDMAALERPEVAALLRAAREQRRRVIGSE